MAACPDLDLYVDVIAAHRRAIVTACVGASSPECDEEQAKLAALEKVAERCKEGENVGPPDPEDTDIRVVVPKPPRYLSGTVELLAGGGHGVGDTDWRAAVRPSTSLGIRAGGAYGPVGLLLSFEWIDARFHAVPSFYPQRSEIPTMERLRYLVHVYYELRPTADITIDLRAGVGLETALGGYEIMLEAMPVAGAQHVDVTDTDLAFELGVAAWYGCTDTIDVGMAVATPGAVHGIQPEIRFPDMVDLEALVGLRLNRR